MFNFPTDLTDFHRLLTPSEFLQWDLMSIKLLLATKNYLCKSVRSVGDQEGSGQDEQVSVQGDDLTILNGEWWTHSWWALGLLRTASCRCAFSCFRCEAGRATLSRRLLLLQWFRYRPGRCCHHQEYPFRYPSRYPGWYPGWCHHLTGQRPSSA